MFRAPSRGRYVSQEPQLIAERLLGTPLASFGRRFWALLLDVMLFGFLFGALFVGLTAWSFHRQSPDFFRSVRSAVGQANAAGASDSEARRITTEFFILVLDRCPGAFPADLEAALRRGDSAAVELFLDRHSTTIGIGSGKTRLVEGDEGIATMILGPDLLLGRFSSLIGWATCFIGWFTVWTFLGRGRTLGKMLLGIRVVRLDGQRLGLWDCFSRAAGYSASAATLMLGFIEARWHPNRQALHDKVAATVVVKGTARGARD